MTATTRASLSFSEALLATNVAWVHIISANPDIIWTYFDVLLGLVLVLHSGMHYFQYNTSNVSCYWCQVLIFSIMFMLPLLSRIPYFHSQHCQYNITNIACYLFITTSIFFHHIHGTLLKHFTLSFAILSVPLHYYYYSHTLITTDVWMCQFCNLLNIVYFYS